MDTLRVGLIVGGAVGLGATVAFGIGVGFVHLLYWVDGKRK